MGRITILTQENEVHVSACTQKQSRKKRRDGGKKEKGEQRGVCLCCEPPPPPSLFPDRTVKEKREKNMTNKRA